MEELKSIFGEGSLSYEEFEQKLGETGEIKLANLKSGNYVDKSKYEKSETQYKDLQTKFNELTEATKDYGTLKTSYEDLQTKFNELNSKYENTEKLSLINNSNVNPKFAKFVLTEVNSKISEDKDFQTCLKEYLTENKELLNGQRGNYVNLQNGGGEPKTPNELMNKFIRGK